MWEACSLDEIVKLDDPRTVSSDAPNRCCGKEMLTYNLDLVCSVCKRVSANFGDHQTHQTQETHNISNNTYQPFKPAGNNNNIYKLTMIKHTGENEIHQNQMLYREVKQYNFINESFQIPEDVLKTACEWVIAIRGHITTRGMNRRGIIGGCIYKLCELNNIVKTKSQIATMLKVEESHITAGIDIVNSYVKLGVITVEANNIDPTVSFVNKYFEILELDTRYKPFVTDLIKRINEKNIKEIESCHHTSKCIGVIYTLSMILKWNLSHEFISERCDKISRGTYLNIYNAIVKNIKILEKPFHKHSIPLP